MESFSVRNYKSFKNDTLELKPITILLGKNSSGKSSLLNLLLLTQQTLMSVDEPDFRSALRINGPIISLGEIENVFRGKDLSREIELEYNFYNDKFFKICHEDMLKKFFYAFREEIMNFYFIQENIYPRLKPDNKYAMRISTALEQLDRLMYARKFTTVDFDKMTRQVKKIRNQILKLATGVSEQRKSGKTDISKRIAPYITKIQRLDINDFKHSYSFIDKLNSLKSKRISLTFTVKYSSAGKYLFLSGYKIVANKLNILEIKRKTEKENTIISINSDLISTYILKRYRREIANNIVFKNFFLEQKGKYQRLTRRHLTLRQYYIGFRGASYFVTNIFGFIQNSYSLLTESFLGGNINHVGPLRAYPKRHYLSDTGNVKMQKDTIDGENIPKYLKNIRLKSKVNRWISFLGVKFDVVSLDELITKIYAIDGNLKLDITDVGFGYSQALPVILQGFLSKKRSLTIIEQPEIHLHPYFQSHLADLFIDIIKEDPTKKLLIETHSEYILKRMRRKISDGQIKSDDVAIYFINHEYDTKTNRKLNNIKISETGYFKWPKDFMDLDDTMAYLRNQLSIQGGSTK